MLMASMPIAVLMQKRTPHHRWATATWSAAGVIACPQEITAAQMLSRSDEEESHLIPGLRLELHRDEDDGYFENWAAPEPKVFVMWRVLEDRPMPVLASVSYGEGTRMLDSGECADGVDMPPDIHAWLTAYLQAHYQPKPRRGREHG
ncbi:MAG: hypothetical protein JWQ23_620 [Herminiimonas sp.]|nr:hypothetical protein [Herminiimonas sp.]